MSTGRAPLGDITNRAVNDSTARHEGRGGRKSRVVRTDPGKRMREHRDDWALDTEATRVRGHGLDGRPEPRYTLPATYRTMTTEDDRIKLKALLADNRDGGRPLGDVFLEDRDIEYLNQKRAELEEEEFEKWFATTLDFSSPHDVEFARQLLPEFITRREEELKHKLKLMEKIALINLRGPRTKQDLLMIYAVRQGHIDLKVLKNVWQAGETPDNDIIQPGLFNPRRWTRRAHTVEVGGMGMFTGAAVNQGLREGAGILNEGVKNASMRGFRNDRLGQVVRDFTMADRVGNPGVLGQLDDTTEIGRGATMQLV